MPVKSKAKNCFPDYELVRGEDGTWHNMLWGTDLSVGGYVYANPGMYVTKPDNPMGLAAITFDATSLHPTDAIQLNYMGENTSRYAALLAARVAIKHKDFDAARKMFNGKLAKYLTDESQAGDLSTALKTAANSLYGVSYASFDNPARDPRNVNNIIALRGSLVMRTLQKEVEDMGYKVIHIKTDSIKVADPDEKICNYIVEFGKSYGISYEVEHTWNKICLVNDAVFVGQHGADDKKDPLGWETTGKEFQVPYVRKSLFTKEPIEFWDYCTTFNVSKGTLHLVTEEGTDTENDEFIGRVGLFVPMKHGGKLYRVSEEGKRYAASGTTGYLWRSADEVQDMHLEDDIDMSYFRNICDAAIDHINEFGSYGDFMAAGSASDFSKNMNPPET